jgi:hypothetical protein
MPYGTHKCWGWGRPHRWSLPFAISGATTLRGDQLFNNAKSWDEVFSPPDLLKLIAQANSSSEPSTPSPSDGGGLLSGLGQQGSPDLGPMLPTGQVNPTFIPRLLSSLATNPAVYERGADDARRAALGKHLESLREVPPKRQGLGRPGEIGLIALAALLASAADPNREAGVNLLGGFLRGRQMRSDREYQNDLDAFNHRQAVSKFILDQMNGDADRMGRAAQSLRQTAALRDRNREAQRTALLSRFDRIDNEHDLDLFANAMQQAGMPVDAVTIERARQAIKSKNNLALAAKMLPSLLTGMRTGGPDSRYINGTLALSILNAHPELADQLPDGMIETLLHAAGALRNPTPGEQVQVARAADIPKSREQAGKRIEQTGTRIEQTGARNAEIARHNQAMEGIGRERVGVARTRVGKVADPLVGIRKQIDKTHNDLIKAKGDLEDAKANAEAYENETGYRRPADTASIAKLEARVKRLSEAKQKLLREADRVRKPIGMKKEINTAGGFAPAGVGDAASKVGPLMKDQFGGVYNELGVMYQGKLWNIYEYQQMISKKTGRTPIPMPIGSKDPPARGPAALVGQAMSRVPALAAPQPSGKRPITLPNGKTALLDEVKADALATIREIQNSGAKDAAARVAEVKKRFKAATGKDL